MTPVPPSPAGRTAAPETWSLLARRQLRTVQPTVAVSLHDVAPATWPACRRVLAAIAAVAPLRVALLIVPHYRGVDAATDAAFLRALDARLAQGDEPVLHGWLHVDDVPARSPLAFARRRFYTAAEGEFAALDRQETLRRIHAGVQWFAKRGWPLRGFVPPAWLMSRAARAALADTPLHYAALRSEVLLLTAGRRLAGPSLCWSTRAAWRRALSVPLNAVLARRHATVPLLRIALHPHDADHPQVLASWQRALATALATRSARTEGEVADDWIAAIPDQLPFDGSADGPLDGPVTLPPAAGSAPLGSGPSTAASVASALADTRR